MVVQCMPHISPNKFSTDFAFELRPLKYFVVFFCLRHTTLYTVMALHQSKTYLECDRNNWFTVMPTNIYLKYLTNSSFWMMGDIFCSGCEIWRSKSANRIQRSFQYFGLHATHSSPVTSMCVNICSASHAEGRIEKINAQWQMPNIAQRKRDHSNSFNWRKTIPKTHYTKVWKTALHIQVNVKSQKFK